MIFDVFILLTFSTIWIYSWSIEKSITVTQRNVSAWKSLVRIVTKLPNTTNCMQRVKFRTSWAWTNMPICCIMNSRKPWMAIIILCAEFYGKTFILFHIEYQIVSKLFFTLSMLLQRTRFGWHLIYTTSSCYCTQDCGLARKRSSYSNQGSRTLRFLLVFFLHRRSWGSTFPQNRRFSLVEWTKSGRLFHQIRQQWM